jgi:hypothetical protein
MKRVSHLRMTNVRKLETSSPSQTSAVGRSEPLAGGAVCHRQDSTLSRRSTDDICIGRRRSRAMVCLGFSQIATLFVNYKLFNIRLNLLNMLSGGGVFFAIANLMPLALPHTLFWPANSRLQTESIGGYC